MHLTLEPYLPDQHEPAVFALWESALGAIWPASQPTFRRVTVDSGVYEPGDHCLARVDGDLAGFAATQTRRVPGESAPDGEVMLVMVHPAFRRQGIGRRLLQSALDRLRDKGVETAQLGAGCVSYFWPGVPLNLPDAWPFFEACGWPAVVRTYDLVRDLKDYATPPGVYEPVLLQGIEIVTAGPEDLPAVLEFEARHFPRWLHSFRQPAEHGEHADVLFARDADGAVAGTTLVVDPRSRSWQGAFVWSHLLGGNVGGVGPLGVAESMRGRGIGLALAARVTELLAQRGVERSFIGYTWLADWYGRLGYRVFAEHQISERRLLLVLGSLQSVG